MWPDDAYSQELDDRMQAWGGPQGGMPDADFHDRQRELAQLDDDMRHNQLMDSGGSSQVSYGSTPVTAKRSGSPSPRREPPTPEELERRRIRSEEYRREEAERDAREAEQDRLDRLNAVPDERLMMAAAQPRQQSITGTGVSGFTTVILWVLGISVAIALLALAF